LFLPNISQDSYVEMPVSEHSLQHPLANLATLFDSIGLHARDCEQLLVFGEPPYLGTGRQTWKKEEASNGDWQADASIDNEKPAPVRS
jgi:hypothetical protein